MRHSRPEAATIHRGRPRTNSTPCVQRAPAFPVQAPSEMSFKRYEPFRAIDLPDRTRPGKSVTKAPQWCAVDL